MKALFSTLFFLPIAASSQELPVQTRQQLEQLAETTEQMPEADVLLQQLAHWSQKPLDLNQATAAELQLFSFLSGLQIGQFFQYRAKLGKLVSMYELQSIPSWDLATIRKLLPFVSVNIGIDVNGALGKRLKGGEHTLLLRGSRQMQYMEQYSPSAGNRYLGDPYALRMRYQHRHPDGLQWGITTEKDAGEQLWRRGTRSPDFFSVHLFGRNLGGVRAVALGSFTVNMGQGLILWQGLAFGKSSEVLAVKRQSAVLQPYASSGENMFMRGGGVTVGQGRWEASVFGSAQQINAVKGEDPSGVQTITSFGNGGLHRTAAEQAQRRSVEQKVAGMNVRYQTGSLHLGWNAVYYRFSLPIKKADEPYNLYAPAGRAFLNVSTDYSVTYRNLHLFGELALNDRRSVGWVHGLLLSMHPQLDLAIQGRLMQQDYSAINGNVFANNSNPGNEQGIYAGLQFRCLPVLQLKAYADLFRVPWLRYRVDAPSVGREYLVQAEFQPSRENSVVLRYRSEQLMRNGPAGSGNTKLPQTYGKQGLRLHVSRQLRSGWQFRSRAEMVFWQMPDSTRQQGFLWFVELQSRTRSKVDGICRIGFFETDSYDTRLYAYESDLPYHYSIPALFGTGLRAYLTLRWQAAKKLTIWARLAHTAYARQEGVDAVLPNVEGKSRTELKCQLLLTL